MSTDTDTLTRIRAQHPDWATYQEDDSDSLWTAHKGLEFVTRPTLALLEMELAGR
ncbi:MAG TPA: hypothetical protein VMV92_25335 [Streptosporangiaceae bacterium]|nr:hypothetical protein [Streptosporangiaceae bacterium]